MVAEELIEEMKKVDPKKLTSIATSLLKQLEQEMKDQGIHKTNGLVAGIAIYFSSAVLSFIINDLGPAERKAFEEGFKKLFEVGVKIRIVREGITEDDPDSLPSEWSTFVKGSKG